MRFADRPSVQVEVHVSATPEQIWPLVVDLDLLVQVSEELQTAVWEDGAVAAVGSRYVGTNANRHFGQWQTTSTVVVCEPPRVFGWTVGDLDDPNTSWRFTLSPVEAGGTTVSQWMQVGPGESGLRFAVQKMPDKEERIVERRLDDFRAAMRANVDEIKRRAEQA